MTTQTGCCASSSAKAAFERPRFFPRQLVTPDDLTLGQEYFRDKLRRHNRMLHGWGVVCGAKVEFPKDPDANPWKVTISKGYLLGPFGDEIVLDRDLCFDLRTRCASNGAADPCSEAAEPADPWCADRAPKPRAKGDWWVAVRYKEVASRPVPVSPVGCGCGDSGCEYSRWRDGYEVCVLDKCPGSHANPPSLDDISKPRGILDCPQCPEDPWVVLAKVTVADDKGTIASIDNCSCRRVVVSLAAYWTRCNEPLIQRPGRTASVDTGAAATATPPTPVAGNEK